MLHDLLAATGLVICIALGLHMALPARLQARVDAVLRRGSHRLHAQVERLVQWRRRQRQTRAAALEADRVIRRAREAALREQGQRHDGAWTGNVYRPKSFDKPKKPH